MRTCEDCGSRVDSLGRCGNCHEELIINDDQLSEFPMEVSDDWKEKVAEQRADVKQKKDFSKTEAPHD